MFDTRVLPDWIDSYLEYVENTEPPKLFNKWVAISTVAAALQRKVYARFGTDLYFYPNMYIVLVGPSATQKSTSMKPARRLLQDIGVPITAEVITREALIRRFAKTESADISPESVVVINHSSLTVHSSELTVFLGFNNPQFLRDLCDFYDCPNQWQYETKTQGVDKLSNMYFNLVGASTAESLQQALSADAIGGGLTSRMIFIYAEQKDKVVPFHEITEEEKEMEKALLGDLRSIHRMMGGVQVSPEFRELYTGWSLETEENPPFLDERFHGYNGRRRNHLVKLAVISSASRGGSLILSAKDFERSLNWLVDAERDMQRALAGVGRSELAFLIAKVRMIIENFDRKNIPLKFTDILRRCMDDAPEPDLRKVVITLERVGEIKTERIKGSADWRIEVVVNE